ncbi:hypothetical protein BHM03_00021724 [Ensete ventricosum]|nr:hypothetical protein BHM03_00021724 [Ensete ventricosum]
MVGLCDWLLFVRSAWRKGAMCHSSLNASQRDLRCRGGQVTALPRRPRPTPEIPLEEATQKAPEASGKRLVEAPSGQRKKTKVPGRHKPHCEGERSKSRAAKGKKPTAPVEVASAPRMRPTSVKELCSAHPGVDDRDYHIIRLDILRKEVQKLKARDDPDAVVVAKQRAFEA